MSEQQEETQKVGLEHLSDEALAVIVEGAAEQHDTDLARWPGMADIAFRELARRSGENA